MKVASIQLAVVEEDKTTIIDRAVENVGCSGGLDPKIFRKSEISVLLLKAIDEGYGDLECRASH